MLVLSRRLNEKILLPGPNITVKVLAIKSGTVRLGITAPPDVVIVREELDQPFAAKGAEVSHTGP